MYREADNPLSQLWVRARSAWPLVAIAGALVAHSLYFDFLTDDGYISFVFARNLAEHGELVFNLGDRVEGYTNFLWTVLLALLMKLAVPPEIASRVLGTAFGVATLWVVVRVSCWARRRASPSAWDYMPALLLAISSGYACWCSGGLETQMFTFFVALALWRYLERRWQGVGVSLALAALTRPEGLLVLGVLGLHRLLEQLIRERRLRVAAAEWRGLGLFFTIYAPYFAWRWWYYGWLFPNTFYVKMADVVSDAHRLAIWRQGGFYLWQWAQQSGALWAIPLVLIAAWSYRRFASVALLLSGAYLFYTARVGGDFMGLHRFVMPVFVTTALLSGLGLARMGASLAPRSRVAAAGVPAVLVGLFVWSQAGLSRHSMEPVADRGIDRPGYLKLYTHDRALIGHALRPFIRPDDFAIVGGAGVHVYYPRLRAVDVFGLVSEEIAHEVRPHSPRPGHQKWAPASRLLRLEPTLLFHCYDLHRDPHFYRLCGEARYFVAHGYEPVTLHVPGLRERGEYYTFLKRTDRPWP